MKESIAVDKPVSESEKLGVNVLRCRFSEKAEHVPIKKRRFFLRSPSPPSRSPSPHREETERSLKSQSLLVNDKASQNDLVLGLTRDCHADEMNSVRKKGGPKDVEDFSGIFLLAAAACGNSLRREGDHGDGGAGIGESLVPSEVSTEDLSSTEMTGSPISSLPFLTNVFSHGTDSKDIPFEDCSMDVLKDSLTNKVLETVKTPAFYSQDDRSHWDLNTGMDAWGCPLDDQSNYVKDASSPNKIEIPESYDLQSKQTREKQSLSSGFGDHLEVNLESTTSTLDILDSTPPLDIITNMDKTSCLQQNLGLPTPVCDNLGVSSARIQKDSSISEHYVTIAVGTGLIEEKQVDVSSVPLSGISTCRTGVVLNEDAKDGEEFLNLCDDKIASKNTNNLDLCKSLRTVPLIDVIENSGHHLLDSSPIPSELPMPDSLMGHQYSLAMGTKTLNEVSVSELAGEEIKTKSSDKLGLLFPSSPVSYSRDAGRNSSCDLAQSSNVVNLDKPSENNFNSLAYNSECCSVKVGYPEMDCDSQYEDGEVRESIIHAWEECDGEDLEAEHVDYGSDNLGAEREHVMEVEKKDPLAELVENKEIVTCAKGTDSIDSRMKIPGPYRGSRRDSSLTLAGRNRNYMDRLGAEGTETMMVESRDVRRALLSHIDGQTPQDEYHRKNKLCLQERSVAGDWSSRYGRESKHVDSLSKSRYIENNNSKGNRWRYSPDSFRGMKHHHSPNYHGPAVPYGRPAQEYVADGRHMDDSSHCVRRRGSPVERDQSFGMRFDVRPSREFSPSSRGTFGRGGSRMYGPRSRGRGFKGGRYHGQDRDEYIEPTLSHRRPSANRERSFSPCGMGGDPYLPRFYTRSPSRSRTRSPISGNPGFRRRSRSPGFRRRIKSPHQRPGFMADHVVRFNRSMPKSRCSSPHTTRLTGDRNDEVAPYEVESFNQHSSVLDVGVPSRRFGPPPDDIFDYSDSSRNYHSRQHPGGYSAKRGGHSGGFRYNRGNDDADDRGKYGFSRYGMIHHAKRYDMTPVKQFRNSDDDFVRARNSRNQNSDDFRGNRGNPRYYGKYSSDNHVPRRNGEGNSPFKSRDAKLSNHPKSLRNRDGNDNDSFINSKQQPKPGYQESDNDCFVERKQPKPGFSESDNVCFVERKLPETRPSSINEGDKLKPTGGVQEGDDRQVC